MIKKILEQALKSEEIKEEFGISNSSLYEIFEKSLQHALLSLSIDRETTNVTDAPFLSKILMQWKEGDSKIFQTARKLPMWKIDETSVIAIKEESKDNCWVSLDDVIENSPIIFSIFSKCFLSNLSKFKKRSDLESFYEKVNTLVRGFVLKITPSFVLFEIDRVKKISGILRNDDQSPSDQYRIGKYFWVLVQTVERDTLLLDRRSEVFVRKLMENSIECLGSKRVVIKKMVRIAGKRTKIMVTSPDNNNEENESVMLHSVSEVVGASGNHLVSIINEINEPIDVLPWFENIEKRAKYILSPVRVQKISFIEDDHLVLFVQPKDVVSAIGKGGTNIRMIAILLNKKVTISS